MHFFSFIIPLFLVSVLSLSFVQSNDDSLTPFGRKVNDLLPKDTKNELFNQNYKNREEIEKTEEIVGKKFDTEIGIPVDQCMRKELNEAALRLFESHHEGALFKAYTNAIPRILEHLGKLNACNVAYLAKKYVVELEKSAETAPDGYTIMSTYPPLAIANARFLKSEGITSPKEVNQYRRYLIQEFNKYATTMTHY